MCQQFGTVARAVGREAGDSQLRGFNSRSWQLIYRMPRLSWTVKQGITRVQGVSVSMCPPKASPYLCVHLSRQG